MFQNPEDQLFAPTMYQDVAFGPRNLGIDERSTERALGGDSGPTEHRTLAGQVS